MTPSLVFLPRFSPVFALFLSVTSCFFNLSPLTEPQLGRKKSDLIK